MTQFHLKKNNKLKKKFSILSLLELEVIRDFRKDNLYQNLNGNFELYKDDNNSSTKHFGLFINKELISALTLIENTFLENSKLKAIQIRGMSTKKKFQKKGFGSALIEKVINILKFEKKYEILWCNSRIESLGFYKNNYFTPVGNIFNIKNIGKHQKLYIVLKEWQKIQNFT